MSSNQADAPSNNGNGYFANLPNDTVGDRLMQEVERHYRFMLGSGVYTRLWDSHLNYHGVSPRSLASAHSIQRGGKNNQLALMKVNHYRNIAQHMLQLTTSQKLAPIPIATNTDAASQEQVTLAKGILEYYSREKRIDRILRTAAEHAIVYSEGYVLIEWDAKLGDKLGVDPTTNQSVTNGDIKISNILPTDIIKDSTKDSFAELDWIIVRRWKNKYEVASRYALDPQDALNGNTQDDEVVTSILAADPKTVFDKTRLSMISGGFRGGMVEYSDDIPVYEFYHKKSGAVPDGRKVVFLADGTVLYSGPLGVTGVPVRRICPGELIGSPYGYTPMFDLLVIQEAVDALYSAVATNQITFGVQLIMAMKGSDIDFKQLARGLSFLEYNDPVNKPEALNLTHTPEEIFGFIKQLEQAMETVSGINSTVRGNPESSLKSGSALALVQSNAIQFSSGLQESYASIVEDTFTDMLNCYKAFAKDDRTITIVGKYNRSMVKSFSAKELTSINRVVVEAGSALSQTMAGRTQIAQDLLQSHLIKRPEEYLALINTGKLDPMLEGDNAELILIKSENESIGQGVIVHALPIDAHSLHLREHKTCAASPEARENSRLVQALNAHITEHVQFLGDPALANLMTILGETPLLMANLPPEQMAGGTPPGGSPQPPGPQMPPQGADVSVPPPEAQHEPNMPNMPKIAGTNQKLPQPGPK